MTNHSDKRSQAYSTTTVNALPHARFFARTFRAPVRGALSACGLALAVSLAVACSSGLDAGDDGLDPAAEDSTESGSHIWNGARWRDRAPGPIAVCWVNPNDVTAQVRDAVQTLVVDEFHGKTAVRFTGFGACTSADTSRTMIRARFETARTTNTSHPGGQSWVGPVARPLPNEASATLWFGAPSDWNRAEWLKNATLSAALHEFGHAIGLLHEHERSDATGCDAYPPPVSNDNLSVKIGPFDPDSIMNYCRRDRRPSLSAGDVAGIEVLFPGGPPPISADAGVDAARDSGTTTDAGGGTDAGAVVTAPGFTSFSPGVITAGARDTFVTLNGSNFGAATRVTVNGVDVATTLDSSTRVRGRLAASLLARPTTLRIGVYNLAPNGTRLAAPGVGSLQVR
jgi:hypothetical protein